jgi:hypothetical protein
MDDVEFSKKITTLKAKLNLIYAYKSASGKTHEELGIDRFSFARHYADFLYLDMQLEILTLFNRKDPKYWETLEEQFNNADTYYTMILEKIDK